jgi:ATP-dependent DNA helicase RecG
LFRSGEIKSIRYGRYHCTAKLWVIEYIQETGRKIGKSIAQQRKEAILAFCVEPKSRRQMQEHLDISDKRHFMEKVLNPLLQAGCIEMTIPSNPSHVRQRYVAVK